MNTVVSVTPLNVEADSRTFKQASSVARFGHRSVVVEGLRSDGLDRHALPFELVTVPPRPEFPVTVEPLTGVPALESAAVCEEELSHEDEHSHEDQPAREATPSLPASDDARRAPASTPGFPPEVKSPPPAVPITLLDRVAVVLPPGLRRVVGAPWRQALALRRWVMANRWRVSSSAGYLPRLLVAPFAPVGYLLWVLEYARETRRTLRSLPPADLYYLHSPRQYPAVAVACRRNRARLVYDAHDLYSEHRRDGVRRPRVDRWVLCTFDGIERLAVRRATACVTVTDSLARLTEQRFGRPFTVVRNLHDLRLDEDVPDDLRIRLGLDGDIFLLVIVGNAKGIGVATRECLEALTVLPTRVHLACMGRRWETFDDTVEELGLRGRVHFVDPVSPTQVASVIRSADASPILYYPSARDVVVALPNRVAHVIAAGLPLLFPHGLPEIRALCERHGLGLPIDSRDPASIAERVRVLADHPHVRERLAVNVRRVRDELTWQAEEPRLADVVNSSLAGG